VSPELDPGVRGSRLGKSEGRSESFTMFGNRGQDGKVAGAVRQGAVERITRGLRWARQVFDCRELLL